MRLVRSLFCGACVACTAAAGAQATIFDNGPIITRTGVGVGGADVSDLQTALGLDIYGFNCSKYDLDRLADDFTISTTAGAVVRTFTFLVYQTGSTTTSPITEINLRIWDRAPNAQGAVLLHDHSTQNLLTATSFANVYRIRDTDPPLQTFNRPVMVATATLPAAITLLPGTYWVDWQVGGSTAFSGPWNVPVTVLGELGKAGANALQYQFDIATWVAVREHQFVNTPQDLSYRVGGGHLIGPATVTATAGIYRSGTAASATFSDNQYFVVEEGPPISVISPSVEMTAQSTSPSQTSTAMTLHVETSTSATPANQVSQRVQMFNFTTGLYETVDTRAATSGDNSFSITPVGDPSRFIQAGTRAIRARVSWFDPATLFSVGWVCSLDRVVWEVTP
jgi:hypothetical protein